MTSRGATAKKQKGAFHTVPWVFGKYTDVRHHVKRGSRAPYRRLAKQQKCSKPFSHHLEVKDAGVAVPKALAVGDDSVEEAVVQRERGDGRQ